MEELKKEEKQSVLTWVRDCIGIAFGHPLPPAPDCLDRLPPCGVFVTLHLRGALRGCIGSLQSRSPLRISLKEAAGAAAFEDPRFPPLKEEEWEEISLEVSLLSPLEETASPENLVMGRHGALIDGGGRKGLFLPQVATEQGWDREEFMDHLCAKAGLPMDYWHRGPYRLYRFEAQVF